VSSDSIRSRTLKLDEGQVLAKQLGESLRGQLRPALIVMSGQTVGERVSVQGNVLIGRDPSAQLVLPDQGASFRHAYIEDRGGSWVLIDLGSTNGTEVNGARTSEAPLAHGDKLRFGTTMVRFEVQDETDQAYSEAVAQLLNVDDLTGLYLRRRFDAELELLLNEARAASTPLVLLALDLDGIKAINDKHGHLFGAYTISESGKLLGQLLEGRGIGCRFGGDEFIAALPNHTLERGASFGESIRQGVAQHAYVYDGVALMPGISVGVAEFPRHAQTGEALFRVADAALYAAKRNGKNRVECAQ
jgi:two-component system, cell cycle response regulator